MRSEVMGCGMKNGVHCGKQGAKPYFKNHSTGLGGKSASMAGQFNVHPTKFCGRSFGFSFLLHRGRMEVCTLVNAAAS